MNNIFTFVFSLFLFVPIGSFAGEPSFIKEISKDIGLEEYSETSLKNPDIKGFSAFIFTVLLNTQELRIHQMNGEIYNQVYIRDEGQEAVFTFEHDDDGEIIDGTGTLVTDCLNQGSFNYYHPNQAPLGHFAADILPWLVWGNCKDDPSTVNQRIEAYMQDFEEGHALALYKKDGFYLPNNFNYKNTGQSETIAFFAKALEISGFDFNAYFSGEFNEPENQEKFINALASGIKSLLKDA